MNAITKTILAAVGAVLFTAAPAIASAERVYFLVGTRHVYRIGLDPYAHLEERKRIEQDYADQVAADQRIYNKAIADGSSPSVEGPQFNQALNDLAVERDKKLGAIFENADYERTRHPQLIIEGDGPYQVIGINFHYHANVEVFDNFIVYAPWPGYVVVNRPYGWAYGVVYTPGIFFNLYIGWHTGFVAAGRPAFWGFYGHNGPVGIVGVAYGPHGGFVAHGGVGAVIGRGPSRYAPATASHFGGVSRYTSTRSSTVSKYARTRSGGSFSRTSASSFSHSSAGASRYSHTSSSARSFSRGRSSSSFGHSSSRPSSSSHSSFGGSRTSGSFGGGHVGASSHSSGGRFGGGHSGGRRG